MRPPADASTREKLLFILKTKGPRRAAELAGSLGVTPVAVRQHMAGLAQEGLVSHEDVAGEVGRPRRVWSSTREADARFPDGHGELLVGVLRAAREALGDDGLANVIERRTTAQVAAYRERVPPPSAPLRDRVAALTAIRRGEGYLAEWSRASDGSFRLVENHCPICSAAEECAGLCEGELSLFRRVLGRRATVERTEYLLGGERRCVYRIAGR